LNHRKWHVIERQPAGGQGLHRPAGLKPGDEFEIKLGRKQIKLIPLRASEAE